MKFATPKSDEWQVTSGRKENAARASISCHASRVTRHAAAFTLAEVLAALLFLAIVIPAAVEAMHIASRAGSVAARKGAAARVADRILNESLVTTNWSNGTQSGTTGEGTQEFRWTLSSRNWPVDALQLLTVEVKYSVQAQDYSVQLSTLVPQSGSTNLNLMK